jgi:hypothetical protein
MLRESSAVLVDSSGLTYLFDSQRCIRVLKERYSAAAVQVHTSLPKADVEQLLPLGFDTRGAVCAPAFA